MKGTFYALIWCSAPSSGAYTPMGISQYSRLSQPKEFSGDTPVGTVATVDVNT